MISEEISSSVESAKQTAEDLKQMQEDCSDQIEALSDAFTDINVISASIDTYSIDISVSGDKHELEAVFSALRKLGYEPDDRPDELVPTFSTWFKQGGFHKVWLNFSSTQCTRVKTGTKTQEVDVYEVVCE